MQFTPALTQLRHAGRVPSQRILRVRQRRHAVTIFFFCVFEAGPVADGVSEEVDEERERAM